jgi:hypothetical protein
MPFDGIPNEWAPRAYQLNAWSYLEAGGRRAVLVWHRRSGKDNLCLNFTSTQMFDEPGVYWHMLPQKEQARKSVWLGMDQRGVRFIDQAFPRELRTATLENEMRINMRTAGGQESIWQLCGSDNYDSLMGANPRGVVFSEYSLSNPQAWTYVRPILRENNGWAVFNFTPRGMNHAHDLYQLAAARPERWFAELLTVEDTNAITQDKIDEERRDGMSEEMVQQEYYCDFEAPNIGSYYGKALRKAQKQGRIGVFDWVPEKFVYTGWDIGRTDDTSIWFWQIVNGRPRFIDFHSSSGGDVPFYIELLRSKPYKYADPALYLPHDADSETLAAPRSVRRQFKDAKFSSKVFTVRDVQQGIEETRATIAVAEFNEYTCRDGINALKLYQRHYNEERKAFEDRPVHDWTSHPADAMRTAARAWRDEQATKAKPEPQYEVFPGVHMPTFEDAMKITRKRRLN